MYLGSYNHPLPDGFNPTIGGYLDLESYNHPLPDGFNPTIGGYLYLVSYNHPLPDGFNPTIGGGLYLGSGIKASYKQYRNEILSWESGKYIQADGMFVEVLSKKGNVYKVRKIGNTKEFWLVSDGKSTHAHGDTFKKAKEDLKHKIATESFKHKPISGDTIVTIERYRAVTGACEFGVKSWMQQHGVSEGLTAKELLPILEKTNAYNYQKFKSLVIAE